MISAKRINTIDYLYQTGEKKVKIDKGEPTIDNLEYSYGNVINSYGIKDSLPNDFVEVINLVSRHTKASSLSFTLYVAMKSCHTLNEIKSASIMFGALGAVVGIYNMIYTQEYNTSEPHVIGNVKYQEYYEDNIIKESYWEE